MKEEHKPLLLEYIFGENVETVPDSEADRLWTWAEAFDEWLREMGEKYTKSSTKQARLAWRRLQVGEN